MAIHYPGGNLIYREINAVTMSDIIENLKTALVDAGWTLAGSQANYCVFTFNGLPQESQSCTIDNLRYEYRATLTQTTPRQVKLGATREDCARNLMEAINGATGWGTDFSEATTPHPSCRATNPSPNVVRVETIASGGGSDVVNKEASVSLSNVTLDMSRMHGAGHKLDSLPTAQGLQARLWLHDPGLLEFNAYGWPAVKPTNVAETSGTGGITPMLPKTARKLQVRAHGHGIWAWVMGSGSRADQCSLQFEVPYIRDANVAPLITSVSDHDGKVKITTATKHGASSNMKAVISGVRGDNAAIDGAWTITVVDEYSYVLEGSGFETAEYETGSARAAISELAQISQAFFCGGHSKSPGFNPTVSFYSFRDSLAGGDNASESSFHALVNSYSNLVARAQIAVNYRVADNSVRATFNGYSDLTEARVGWIQSQDGIPYKIGELWGAFTVSSPASMDIMRTGFDGHDWIQFCHNDRAACGSLWLTIN
jgi:hypothetical protein